MSEKRTILFLDKVLLSAYRKEPRGVEVFNLNLIKDLAGAGITVTVPVHASWALVVAEWIENPGLEVLPLPEGKRGLLATCWLVRRLRRREFSVLLLANVANRLIVTLMLLRLFRLAPRCVLIAHREPTRRSLCVQKLWPSAVVAVNGKIAGHFKRLKFPEVAVSYGIANAGRFRPREATKGEGAVDFCLLGHLDSAWKGADTAVEAFRALPEAEQAGLKLHLVAFHEPPEYKEPGIIPYAWMSYDEMPAFVRNMDVLLVPSRDEEVMRETFSQAMVQGMLSGLPAIVSDLPVLVEKLDEGGGIIFKSTEELSLAMLQLAKDPALRKKMGEEGRKTALARYVWNTDDFIRRFLFPEKEQTDGQ